jgi:hypothetical protein
MGTLHWLSLLVLLIPAYLYARRRRRLQRLHFIDTYRYHPSMRKRLGEKYPHLSEAQINLLFDGLRDYFAICLQAGSKPVAMPSRAVDEAWHTFIIYTRAYQDYCQRGLGRFLHHTPVEVMSGPTTAQESIKRAWRLACHRETLNPRLPAHLPRLFAMDALLEIADGFIYVDDCRDPEGGHQAARYCAAHIGCASGCSGDTGANTRDNPIGRSGGGDTRCGGGSGCGSGCGGD